MEEDFYAELMLRQGTQED